MAQEEFIKVDEALLLDDEFTVTLKQYYEERDRLWYGYFGRAVFYGDAFANKWLNDEIAKMAE